MPLPAGDAEFPTYDATVDGLWKAVQQGVAPEWLYKDMIARKGKTPAEALQLLCDMITTARHSYQREGFNVGTFLLGGLSGYVARGMAK